MAIPTLSGSTNRLRWPKPGRLKTGCFSTGGSGPKPTSYKGSSKQNSQQNQVLIDDWSPQRMDDHSRSGSSIGVLEFRQFQRIHNDDVNNRSDLAGLNSLWMGFRMNDSRFSNSRVEWWLNLQDSELLLKCVTTSCWSE
jgi:hypothetical protein